MRHDSPPAPVASNADAVLAGRYLTALGIPVDLDRLALLILLLGMAILELGRLSRVVASSPA